jgi:hypothetical protein
LLVDGNVEVRVYAGDVINVGVAESAGYNATVGFAGIPPVIAQLVMTKQRKLMQTVIRREYLFMGYLL